MDVVFFLYNLAVDTQSKDSDLLYTYIYLLWCVRRKKHTSCLLSGFETTADLLKQQIQDIEMKTSPFLPILRLQQGWSPVVDFTKVHAGNLGDALTQVQGLKGGSGVSRLGRGFAPFFVGIHGDTLSETHIFRTETGANKRPNFSGTFWGFVFVSHYKDSLFKATHVATFGPWHILMMIVLMHLFTWSTSDV